MTDKSSSPFLSDMTAANRPHCPTHICITLDKEKLNAKY